MNSSKKPQVDMDKLAKLCENKTLQKGILLAQSGAVSKFNVISNTATAQVKGSKIYLVHLDFSNGLHSTCTCPAASYQTLCKHGVAVAISIQNPQPMLEQETNRQTLKKYLQRLDEEDCLNMLLDYLEEDEYTWNRLLNKVKIDQSPVNYNDLKKLITKALPREQIWDWRNVQGYFESAEEQLDNIIQSMESLDVEQQWKLINYVNERLNKVLEEIDDSNGERYGIEDIVNTHMPKIFAKLSWDEQEKAQWMFDRLTEHTFDIFPSIEESFKEVWENNSTFLDLCRQAIDNASPDEYAWHLRSWAEPLIANCAHWREEITIKQKIARATSDYLEIVDMFIDNQEPLEAEFWLMKAKKMAQGYKTTECDRAQFRLYVALDEIDSAWKHANRMLEQAPSFPHYKSLVKFKAEHQIEDTEFLLRVEQLFKEAYHPTHPFRMLGDGSDALALFYIDNQQLDKACQWVEDHKISNTALLKLANKVLNDMPNKALDYYLEVAISHINETKNDSYIRALELLQAIEKSLKPHSEQLERFYTEIALLAQNYKRKRNMFNLLKQHYGGYL